MRGNFTTQVPDLVDVMAQISVLKEASQQFLDADDHSNFKGISTLLGKCDESAHLIRSYLEYSAPATEKKFGVQTQNIPAPIKVTFEDHSLHVFIIRILSSEYGLSCERRTIYANIELLIKFGYSISTFQENGQGYFLREHQFSVTEIVAMFESMQGSNQLSADEQRLLRNKLLSTLSDSQKRTFQNA